MQSLKRANNGLDIVYMNIIVIRDTILFLLTQNFILNIMRSSDFE